MKAKDYLKGVQKDIEVMENNLESLNRKKEIIIIKIRKLDTTLKKLTEARNKLEEEKKYISPYKDKDYSPEDDQFLDDIHLKEKEINLITYESSREGSNLTIHKDYPKELTQEDNEKIEKLKEELVIIRERRQYASDSKEMRIKRTESQIRGIDQRHMNRVHNEIGVNEKQKKQLEDEILEISGDLDLKKALLETDEDYIKALQYEKNRGKIKKEIDHNNPNEPNAKKIAKNFLKLEIEDRDKMWSKIKDKLVPFTKEVEGGKLSRSKEVAAEFNKQVTNEIKSQLGGYKHASFKGDSTRDHKDLTATMKEGKEGKYQNLKGDALKTAILSDLKLEIDKAQSPGDLKKIRETFKDTIAVLAQAQGKTTQFLSMFLNTSSINALNRMMTQKEKALEKQTSSQTADTKQEFSPFSPKEDVLNKQTLSQTKDEKKGFTSPPVTKERFNLEETDEEENNFKL